MIKAQFDLQNIINEMKTADRVSATSPKSESERFSATLDRVSRNEAFKQRSTPAESPSEQATRKSIKKQMPDPRDDAGSGDLTQEPDDVSTQNLISHASGHKSGNILPLLPPERSAMNQVMLESKRPILVGELKATAPQNDHIQNLADSGDLQIGTEIGMKKNSETGAANPKLQGPQKIESVFFNGLPSKSGKLMNAENFDVENKDNSSLNGIHRSLEARNSDLALGTKSPILPSSSAFDAEAFKEGLSKIIKNQIVSSFSGKNVSLKMVLTPESLGEIEVDLHFTKDKSLQVTLRPETLEIAKLIQTHSSSLREQLSQEHKGLLSLNMTNHFGGEGNLNGSDSNRSGNDDNSGFVSLKKQNLKDPDASTSVHVDKNPASSLIDTFV